MGFKVNNEETKAQGLGLGLRETIARSAVGHAQMHLCARANAESECRERKQRANTCTSGTLPPSASPLARRRSPPSCAPACAGLAPRRQPHDLGRASMLGADHKCTLAAPERALAREPEPHSLRTRGVRHVERAGRRLRQGMRPGTRRPSFEALSAIPPAHLQACVKLSGGGGGKKSSGYLGHRINVHYSIMNREYLYEKIWYCET